jgi:hypothetical protein
MSCINIGGVVVMIVTVPASPRAFHTWAQYCKTLPTSVQTDTTIPEPIKMY